MKEQQNELLRVMSAVSGKWESNLTPTVIVEAACAALNVDKATMESALRNREVSECRFIIVHLISSHNKMAPIEISPFIGFRNRATVSYCLKAYGDLLYSSSEFRAKVYEVNKKLEEICD